MSGQAVARAMAGAVYESAWLVDESGDEWEIAGRTTAAEVYDDIFED